MNDTKTVEQWMLEELWGRGLRVGETDQALAFAKRKLDASGFQAHTTIVRKQGGGVLVKDCWSTPAGDYSEEALEALRGLIEHHTFTWLVNQLRSRS